MKKSQITQFKHGTPEYVVLHARWQRSRGRSPSATLSWVHNPREALRMAERLAYFPKTPGGIYLGGKIPDDYKCSKCGGTHRKLWRRCQSSHIELLCATCAGEDQKMDVSSIRTDGCIFDSQDKRWGDQIGWFVPAVPSEDNTSYWGYTSVPDPACEWWRNLPNS